jgi:hypothetical protein
MLMAVTLGAGRSAAQDRPIVIPVASGTVTGEVVSALSGRPIPFVLITLERPRTEFFSSESGRFVLPPLEPGEYHLRVRQLGYQPLEVVLAVGGAAPQLLRLALSPMPLQLPTLIATACVSASELDSSARAVLDAASESARRLAILQREYPYVARYATLRELSTRDGRVLGRMPGVVEFKSWEQDTYRPGKAISDRGRNPPHIEYFTATAVLSDDFRETHCFRFGGIDSAGPEPLFRLEFEPLTTLRGADWAGELELDATGVLRKSRARLVMPRPRDSWPREAICVVQYEAVGGVLPVEQRLSCLLIAGSRWPTDVQEEWQLTCQRFTKRLPGSQTGFSPDSTGAWAGRMCPGQE